MVVLILLFLKKLENIGFHNNQTNFQNNIKIKNISSIIFAMIFFRLLFAMCLKNANFIKNQEYPICKTCQHYLPNNIFFPNDQYGVDV